MQRVNIPKGWESKKLSTIGQIVSGGTPDTDNIEYWNGDVAWLTPSEVSGCDTKYLSDTVRYITDSGLQKSSAILLPEKTLIICTRATIGDCCINSVPMCTNQGFKSIISSDASVEFLYYVVKHNKNAFIRKACGSTFLEISKKDVENLTFAIPPLSEQEKIAEILSCWDDAIEQLQNLIAEKKELKRGLMQQLLTGKKRLPSFSKPWDKIKLCVILREISEKTIVNNQHKVLSVTKNGVCSQEDYFDKQIASENNIGYKILHKHNLVFSPMNLWMGSLGFSDYDIGIVSPAYKIFTINEDIADYRFLKYLMITSNMIYLYRVNSEIGASIVRRNLDLEGLLSSWVFFPCLEEQHAIADMLMSADAEIDLLNKKLDVLTEQKKGLMQKLLTGEIRVKVDAHE
ncbi:MAG: restriction endonuclease subunit S [Muribaculaceae bacterium]|nr:restriction endonuclease subunit S [Muribaculaceae bacterium]